MYMDNTHKPYNFLMYMDNKSIDKNIATLGIEAFMFWELPKVELALDNLCRKWFSNECKGYKKDYLDLREPDSEIEDNLVGTAKGDNAKR